MAQIRVCVRKLKVCITMQIQGHMYVSMQRPAKPSLNPTMHSSPLLWLANLDGASEGLHLQHLEYAHHVLLQAIPPLVCAHGGDAESYPPNTQPAFKAALNGGAGCVEVGVMEWRADSVKCNSNGGESRLCGTPVPISTIASSNRSSAKVQQSERTTFYLLESGPVSLCGSD